MFMAFFFIAVSEVTRSCKSVSSSKKDDGCKTTNVGRQTTECLCSGDKCNGSTNIRSSASITFFMGSFLLYLILTWFRDEAARAEKVHEPKKMFIYHLWPASGQSIATMPKISHQDAHGPMTFFSLLIFTTTIENTFFFVCLLHEYHVVYSIFWRIITIFIVQSEYGKTQEYLEGFFFFQKMRR